MADVPEPRNGPGWMVMTHPGLAKKDGSAQYAEVTKEAFEVTWKPKGWQAAASPSGTDPAAGTTTPPPAPPAGPTGRLTAGQEG